MSAEEVLYDRNLLDGVMKDAPIISVSQGSELRSWKNVLGKVGQAFQTKYGVSPEEIPGLTRSSIRFLSPEEYLRAADVSHLFDGYLLRTLSLLGVKRDEFFTTKLRAESTMRIDALRFPETVFVAEESYPGLKSENMAKRDIDLAFFGIQLSQMALGLLPKPCELDCEVWKPLMRAKIHFAINAYGGRGSEEPENKEEITKAKEVLDFILDEDPSIRVVARGGEIITLINQEGVERPLVGLGLQFNREIGLLLNKPLRSHIIESILGRYDLKTKQRIKAIVDRRLPEVGFLSDTERFLNEIGLSRSVDLFQAFKESLIPDVYLQVVRERQLRTEKTKFKQKHGKKKKTKAAKSEELLIYPLI